MKGVLFRVRQDDSPRFPVIPQVSVNDGVTWHDIPVAKCDLHETVDGPPSLTLRVYALGNWPGAA